MLPLFRASSNLYTTTGIRNFIVAIVVKVASVEVIVKKEKTYLNKLNLILVQVRSRLCYIPNPAN
jgi:hypothetical protein